MTQPAWTNQQDRPLQTIFRNVATRYLSVAAEMILGLITLPFNLHHLGTEAYGLWMLTAGVTIHFSLLDLGYGGAMVKFMAQYRAHKDARALNEIASTLFFLFAAVGVLAYVVILGVAFNLDHLFNITQAQAATGKWILLIIGVNVAINFPFSVYGGVSSGFQRYDINNMVAIVSNSLVAAVNIAVVLAGFGLIPLVGCTALVRFLTYFVYRRTAYRVFPALRLRPSLVRRARLREVTGFSVYASIIDWANKLNYELDEIVIGVFLGTGPVAVWAVADRIISGTQRLTNQGNAVLLPVVVDSDATQQTGRLQKVLLEGTRLSLATVVPIAIVLIVLADALIRAWIGKPEIMPVCTGAPDPRVCGRASGRQRDEYDAAEGRRAGAVRRPREYRHGSRQLGAQRAPDRSAGPAGRGHRDAHPDRLLVHRDSVPGGMPARRPAGPQRIPARGVAGRLAGGAGRGSADELALLHHGWAARRGDRGGGRSFAVSRSVRTGGRPARS